MQQLYEISKLCDTQDMGAFNTDRDRQLDSVYQTNVFG